jgi:ornithine cyclodeaminase
VSLLLASHADVTELLPMRDCMDAMSGVLRALAEGKAFLPLRTVIRLAGTNNAFALMPAMLDSPRALGAKIIAVFPGNDRTPYDSHQGVVLLFETEHGRLVAIIDASSITAIRTAAVSGVATRLLARDDSRTLALLGAGVQASTHLEAMAIARPIEQVRVWSRTPERARRFAARTNGRFDLSVEAVPSARAAVDRADIICTVTASREPVLMGEWITPGTHVNAVGASIPSARELDSAAVARARLYVDRRESAVNEAGDFLIPRQEGTIGDDHIIGELGDVLVGSTPGRSGREEITLFKSLGLAVEDLAAAHLILEKARETEKGSWLDLGGMRDEGS